MLHPMFQTTLLWISLLCLSRRIISAPQITYREVFGHLDNKTFRLTSYVQSQSPHDPDRLKTLFHGHWKLLKVYVVRVLEQCGKTTCDVVTTFCQVTGITSLLGKGSQDNKYTMTKKKHFYIRWMKTNVYSPLLLLPSILPFLVLYSGKQTKTIFFLLPW